MSLPQDPVDNLPQWLLLVPEEFTFYLIVSEQAEGSYRVAGFLLFCSGVVLCHQGKYEQKELGPKRSYLSRSRSKMIHQIISWKSWERLNLVAYCRYLCRRNSLVNQTVWFRFFFFSWENVHHVQEIRLRFHLSPAIALSRNLNLTSTLWLGVDCFNFL